MTRDPPGDSVVVSEGAHTRKWGVKVKNEMGGSRFRQHHHLPMENFPGISPVSRYLDQEGSPEDLHDLPGYDEVKKPVDLCPGIIKPFHYAVFGDKPGRSLRVYGEYQGPSRFSGPVMDGTD